MENDSYLSLHKEPLTYHRGGQWFKSSTAHHPDSSPEGHQSDELLNIRELLEVLLGPEGSEG